MAGIDEDLAAAIAAALGVEMDTDELDPEPELPEMSDDFFRRLADLERKVNG